MCLVTDGLGCICHVPDLFKTTDKTDSAGTQVTVGLSSGDTAVQFYGFPALPGVSQLVKGWVIG